MIGDVMPSKKNDHAFNMLYVSSFVLSFHLFFVIYMNSSFLSSFVNENFVGLIYMISSLLSIIVLLLISRILRLFGNYKTLVVLTLCEFFAFIGLAFFKSAFIVIPLFTIYSVIFPIILYNFDVFLEGYTKVEEETGRIRGTFLTVVNTALVLAPLIAGIILTNGDYWKIYLIAALFLLPFLVLIRSFKDFEDPTYHPIRIKGTLMCILNHKSLYNIFIAQFAMRFFFSWMVIYMPIYMHSHIGFSWTEIGIITAIMLLPFVLFEYPAGKIADKYLGEKSLLIIGLAITGIFTASLSFIVENNFLIWTTLLFITRVGISLVEIMTESYFFKHVDGSDNNTISFFRITRPTAYIIGPIVGTIALLFVEMQYIWIILSLVVLLGIISATKIEDTHHGIT